MNDSKTCIITGATSGLGLQSAKEIAQKGYNLILLARNVDKLKTVREEILVLNPAINIWVYQVDFSTIEATKKVAAQIKQEHHKIDVLLNNAGIVNSSFELTKEGFEKTFATNHLGYFTLTLSLLPLLMNVPKARIVNVASNSHYKSALDFESFTKDKEYFILKAYGQSKLANVLFTYYLSNRLKDLNITVNAINPGRVRTPIGGKSKGWIHRLGWNTLAALTGVNVEKGAQTQIFLSTSSKVEGLSGKYFDSMKEKQSSSISYDEKLQKDLWKWSEEVTGLNLEFVLSEKEQPQKRILD